MDPLPWEKLLVAKRFSDKRLCHRAIVIGEAMTKTFDHPNDTDAAYDFFENRKIGFQELMDGAITELGEYLREAGDGVTLLHIQDSTELNLSHLKTITGLGTLGNPTNQGIFLHLGLVVDTEGVPNGVLHAKTWVRPAESRGKAKTRQKRPFEDKESYHWWETIAEAENRVERQGLLLHVGDRESDIYELLRRADEAKYRVLIRAAQDRRVQGEGRRLWAELERLSPSAEQVVHVPARPAANGRPAQAARDANVSIRYRQVTLCAPHKQSGTVDVSAILVREEHPPADVDPLEWLLLTTDPISTPSDAILHVQWYRYRWCIEEYFKVVKSGCRVEDRQFESRRTFENSLAMSLLASVRLLAMTKRARIEPDLPSKVLLDAEEEQVLILHAQSTFRRRPTPLLLAEAVRILAGLGGHQSRRGDGPPGWSTLWLGYHRLCMMVAGHRLAPQRQPRLSKSRSQRKRTNAENL